jgi:group I intron endonuclease
MVTIYKITSPSGRIYIGQTVNFKRRKVEYKRNKCKSQTLLYNSFIKYSYDNHIFEILEEVSKELADKREEYYINHFDTYLTSHGLNLAPGGKRPAPKKGSDHYKAKKVYQYSKDGTLVKTWKCITDIQNTLGYNRNVIGNSIRKKFYAYGYYWSFNKKFKTLEHKIGGIISKPILQFDLDGNLLNEYTSINHASKELNICRRTIKNSLTNHNKKRIRHPFIWEYA